MSTSGCEGSGRFPAKSTSSMLTNSFAGDCDMVRDPVRKKKFAMNSKGMGCGNVVLDSWISISNVRGKFENLRLAEFEHLVSSSDLF